MFFPFLYDRLKRVKSIIVEKIIKKTGIFAFVEEKM